MLSALSEDNDMASTLQEPPDYLFITSSYLLTMLIRSRVYNDIFIMIYFRSWRYLLSMHLKNNRYSKFNDILSKITCFTIIGYNIL